MDISKWPDLLTLTQVRQILNCSRDTVYRWKPKMQEDGVKFLTIHKQGRAVRVDRDSLFDWLDNRMLEEEDAKNMER